MPVQDAATWSNKKLAWERLKQLHIKEEHMDAELLYWLLQLVSMKYKDNFNLIKKWESQHLLH